MSWSSVALYTLTGTLTSPKEIEPFQMERIESVCPYGPPDTRVGDDASAVPMCDGAQAGSIRQVSARAGDSQRSRRAGRLECLGQRLEVQPGELAASLRAQ